MPDLTGSVSQHTRSSSRAVTASQTLRPQHAPRPSPSRRRGSRRGARLRCEELKRRESRLKRSLLLIRRDLSSTSTSSLSQSMSTAVTVISRGELSAKLDQRFLIRDATLRRWALMRTSVAIGPSTPPGPGRGGDSPTHRTWHPTATRERYPPVAVAPAAPARGRRDHSRSKRPCRFSAHRCPRALAGEPRVPLPESTSSCTCPDLCDRL